jgi:hypothetical protein
VPLARQSRSWTQAMRIADSTVHTQRPPTWIASSVISWGLTGPSLTSSTPSAPVILVRRAGPKPTCRTATSAPIKTLHSLHWTPPLTVDTCRMLLDCAQQSTALPTLVRARRHAQKGARDSLELREARCSPAKRLPTRSVCSLARCATSPAFPPVLLAPPPPQARARAHTHTHRLGT